MWLESNGLKLNDGKSELVLFGSKRMLSKINHEQCQIRIGNCYVKPAQTARNLGVIFYANLTFNNHISYVSQSVRFQLRNLSFIRKYLSPSAAESLIHALISSRIDFSNSLFGNLPQKEVNRLQRLQNSAARLLTYTKKSSHITPILQSLHWLPVVKRITFKILLLVYYSLHSIAPAYLQNSLTVYAPSRSLRSSNSQSLQVPRVKRSWGDRSFSYLGPKLWNDLPIEIRQSPSLDTFKTLLKTYLFEQ